MNIRAPLPKDTSYIFKNYDLKKSNVGLLFNKYVFSWQDDWKMKEGKKDFLKYIHDIFASQKLNREYIALQIRQESVCKGFEESGWFVKRFELKTKTRLILGLGGTNVLETGITLHPLYGFPYLPASGLKGLARAYAEISEALSPEETIAIFGSEDKDPQNAMYNRLGNVVFLDGLPKTFPKLDLDVMNPHYSEYYQEKKDNKDNLIPPGDYFNPVPIFFIAVSEGETFSFVLISRDSECIKKAIYCLIGGLTELGAGGKTNVGYGYFESPSAEKATKAEETIDGDTIKRKPFEIEKKIFNDVTIIYNPGNRSLTTTVEGKKAFVEHIKDEFIPEHLWLKLKKDKKIKASIVVEPLGNAFKIIKVEG